MSELMKCGHSANATHISKDGTKKPCCVICNCVDVDDNKPDLTGRKAKCTYYGMEVDHNETCFPKLMTRNSRGRDCCGSIVDSSYDLPFFKHSPDKQYDEFYCGCQSWN